MRLNVWGVPSSGVVGAVRFSHISGGDSAFVSHRSHQSPSPFSRHKHRWLCALSLSRRRVSRPKFCTQRHTCPELLHRLYIFFSPHSNDRVPFPSRLWGVEREREKETWPRRLTGEVVRAEDELLELVIRQEAHLRGSRHRGILVWEGCALGAFLCPF